MRASINRAIGGGLAMALCALAFGASPLRLDGILIVKGLPLDGARVIVLTKDGEAQVLTEGLSHFTLNLDLQKDYLVSFERSGCVSKQLRFNTNVPPERMNPEGFRFPFQVTLEAAPEGQRMEYAGPVGYIHFDEKLKDFSYNTDYRILKENFLAEQLELVQSQLRAPVQPVTSRVAAPANEELVVASTRTHTSVEPAKPLAPYDMIAPVVSRTPPMVHVLGSSEVPSPPVIIRSEPTPTAVVQHVNAIAPTRTPEKPVMAVASPEPLRVDEATGVVREVQVDSLRVITITRFQKGTDTKEYRRVVSYYGGTTYFCNGYACSENTYQLAISQ